MSAPVPIQYHSAQPEKGRASQNEHEPHPSTPFRSTLPTAEERDYIALPAMRISDSPDDEVTFRARDNKRPPEFKGVNVLPSPLTKLCGPTRMHQMPNRGELSALASRLRRVHIDESPPRSRTADGAASAIGPSRLTFDDDAAEAVNKENRRRNPFGSFTPRQPKKAREDKEGKDSKSTPLADVSPNVIAAADSLVVKKTPNVEVADAASGDAPAESDLPRVITITPKKRLSFMSNTLAPQDASTTENSETLQSKTPSKVSFKTPVKTPVKTPALSPVPSLKIEVIRNDDSASSTVAVPTFSARGTPMEFTPAVRDSESQEKPSETTTETSLPTVEPSPMNISETPLVQRDSVADSSSILLEGTAELEKNAGEHSTVVEEAMEKMGPVPDASSAPIESAEDSEEQIEAAETSSEAGATPSEASESAPPEEDIKIQTPAPPKTPVQEKKPAADEDIDNATDAMPTLGTLRNASKDALVRTAGAADTATPKAISPPSLLRNKRISSARRLSPQALRKVKRFTSEDLDEAKRLAILLAVREANEEAANERKKLEKQLAAERKEKEELHAVLAEYETTMSKMATDKRNSQRGPCHAMLDVEVARLKTELFETTEAFNKLKERYADAKETIAVMEGKESRVVEQNHELRQSLLELQKWSNDLKANSEKKLAKAFENVNQFRSSFLDRDARANKALSELKLANRDLEQQKAACAETATRLSATEVKLHEAQDAAASLQAALEVARASLKDTTVERNALREEADSSRLQLARMQDEYDRLRESESKASDAVLKVASLELETRTLKANAYDQMSKNRKLEKLLEEKDKECEELNNICEELLSNLEKGKNNLPAASS